MLRKLLLIISGISATFAMESCFRTCDCFDEPDDAFSFGVDLKSYKSGLSIKEFLSAADSNSAAKYYKIKVYQTDSTFFEDDFQWHGDGKHDSIVGFVVWWPPKKVIIDIDTIGLSHTFTEFTVEGFRKGRSGCKCFTPTKKTVKMDDSVTLDVLNSGIFFKKE